MSNYKIGAFEALEWTWQMLRGYKGRSRGVDEARHMIKEILSSMGNGDDINFCDKITEAQSV